MKVDQQIIYNLKYNEALYRNKQYTSIDNIIFSKCTGCRIPREGNQKVYNELAVWIISKNGFDSEIFFNNWVKYLKQDMYLEFKKVFYRKNEIVKSMADITKKVKEKTIVARIPQEVVDFNTMINSWGVVQTILHNGNDSDSWDIIKNLTIMYTRKLGIKDESGDILKENKVIEKEFFICVYLNKNSGLTTLEIRLGEAQDIVYKIEGIKKFNMEKFPKLLQDNNEVYTLDSFIKAIEGQSKKRGVRRLYNERYDMLLELYTGYLKYGSVDNYIKYCQEDDERVALNTKIA